jgi:hypothetical protein
LSCTNPAKRELKALLLLIPVEAAPPHVVIIPKGYVDAAAFSLVATIPVLARARPQNFVTLGNAWNAAFQKLIRDP